MTVTMPLRDTREWSARSFVSLEVQEAQRSLGEVWTDINNNVEVTFGQLCDR
jgi:hypothetical protein